MPISFEVPNIHEIHAFETLIQRVIEMEKKGEIIINKVILDALYFNKRIWWMYGHYKQMIENYHNDLKNKFGIRKLPSQKLMPFLFILQ